MRFTERELTAALTGAAKSVLARRRDVRRGRSDIETAWADLDRVQRFRLLDGLGDQVLPVLVALPDVEVLAGTRPTFTERQVTETVEGLVAAGMGRLRRSVMVRTRTTLVMTALAHVPPRQDPDTLVVPDHL